MRRLLLAVAAALVLAAPAHALSFKPVLRGLDAPLYVASTEADPSALYVVEQPGRVLRVVGSRQSVFLDIRPLIRSGGEQGLLSIAFSPGYARDGRLFVNYTDVNGDTRVVEYRRRAGGQPARGRQLLFVKQPYSNHNGGQLQFGPDGKLWVGMGDGGSAGDPEDRAQNLRSRLGKLLRIDVGSGAVTLGAYGLRNPWRFSFDRETKDLYIADVGQGAWEEIDFWPAGATGLPNFGWSVYEAREKFKDTTLTQAGPLVEPIAYYSHGEGCSVTGGYVYRGRAYPALRGRYVYGDYCTGRTWTLVVRGGKATNVRRERPVVRDLSSFGESAAGELYATALSGTLYRVTP